MKRLTTTIALCLTAATLQLSAADVAPLLTTINAVGAEGRGNAEASEAWTSLSNADASNLIAILNAIDPDNSIAANWLRAAADTIVDREMEKGGSLPLADLGDFLIDTRNDPKARRFAYELIARVEPATAEALIPGLLNDPSVELRRDAVQRLIDQAKDVAGKDKAAASIIYRQALNAARDKDQVDDIAKALRDAGREVDLPTHFGFLMDWKVIGPFDNTGNEGFDKAFGPEKELDFQASYDGKSGKVSWSDYSTTDDYGKVDFNTPYPGLLKEVTAYAYTEFHSASGQAAELRLGCKNGWKIWLNGEFLFGRDEYHRGQRLDQYRLPVQLKEGKNAILIKLTQNEMVQPWT